jgi:ferredoxin
VLVSAGIGVTPVLAMLHRLAAERSTREVWWLHTARNADQHAFAVEAHLLLETLAHAHERIFYTAGPPVGPGTVSGRLTATALADLGIPADSGVYLCGPDGFMAAMRIAFTALGVDGARVHSEVFGTLAPFNPGVVGAAGVPPHPPAGEPGTGPRVTFARSGLDVPWAARYASLLEFAEACDVPTRWSCRSGVCHTCVTTALSGSVSYTTRPLLEPGAGEVLVCCAVPTADTVLDL